MIITYKPFQANPWMNGFFGELTGEEGANLCGALPRIDVADNGDQLVLLAETPGLKKEDLKIVVHEGVLTLSGERKEPAQVEGARWVRNEISTGKFQRSIELPAAVDGGKIAASLTNGILRVVLPKAEEARPREITIQ